MQEVVSDEPAATLPTPQEVAETYSTQSGPVEMDAFLLRHVSGGMARIDELR